MATELEMETRAAGEYRSPDPRYEVRRARPHEYERIYELVDEAFGVRRPRAVYDWLYRDNPRGGARCWAVIERSSGRWMSSASSWPWPLAQGRRACRGAIFGDLVSRPDSQRRGLSALRYAGFLSDPVLREEIAFGWANDKSRAWLEKQGEGSRVMGPLWEARLDLLPGNGLARLLRGFRRAPWGAPRDGLRVQEVESYDGAFDMLTTGCNASEGFWSPRDADFLNWRYRRHPTHHYRALSLWEGDRVVAHTVLRLMSGKALLMEFTAPPSGRIAAALLETVLKASQEAGCRRLSFFATPQWPHWPGLAQAGWSRSLSPRYLYVTSPPAADAIHLERWQLLPGDAETE